MDTNEVSVLRAAGDRLVRAAEKFVGEDFDAALARIPKHPNDAGFDPFGFDPETSRYALAAAALIHRLYFRTEVTGLDHLPENRVLLVANHSGQVPLDAVVLSAALMLDANPPRLPRSMVEKWTAQLPFISVFFQRCGQVVGSPENARRLLQQEEALLVFPEGIRGISKPFEQRYQLVDFGLGFMRLALETNTPIVPVAIVGAEEQYISLGNAERLAKLLKLPVFPLLPQLLFGMVLPLPVKYRLHFGEPLRFSGDPDDEDAVIEERVERVRAALQTKVNELVARRPSPFF